MIGDVAEKVKAITSWQECKYMHPLTCGNDSRHKPLIPVVGNHGVELHCLQCEYRQSHVPGVVYQRWENICNGKDSTTNFLNEFAKPK